MNKNQLDQHVLEVTEDLLKGESAPDLKRKFVDNNVSVFEIDKIFIRAEREINQKYSPEILQHIESGISQQELTNKLSDKIPPNLLSKVMNNCMQDYRNGVKSKINADIKNTFDYAGVVNKYTNNYIGATEVKGWIISYFEVLRETKKRKKRNELFTGAGITTLGIVITVSTYYMATTYGGGRFLLTYGIIISGLITIGKGLSTSVPKVPSF